MTKINRTIAVLGMHRSGTSALMGSLEQAGLFIGDTNHSADDNAKGNRESIAIMTLHDDLLARNGGSWDNPPVRNLRWNPVHRALLSSIIQNYESREIWGFKDPRTLFACDVWLKTIPTLEFAGIFRHPFLVANSLVHRNNMTPEEALGLWFTYNSKLIWLARNKEPFPIVEFSINPDEFNHQLQLLVARLELPSPSLTFFDETLRQQSIPDLPSSAIANRSMKLYELLQEFKLECLSTAQAACSSR